jgi:hypothetical protein
LCWSGGDAGRAGRKKEEKKIKNKNIIKKGKEIKKNYI